MTDAPAAPATAPPDGQALAALVAGKLCHDFISPAGVIVSGLDLLDDPSAADMRDDAIGLIRDSAAKMVALVEFARVAFGAATSAERFGAETLQGLVDGMTKGGRATIDWRLEFGDLSKPQARALVNLAYLTVQALPAGGTATVSARGDGARIRLIGSAEGRRARLKPEAVTGLAGRALEDGLQGQWIQPYWLWLTVADAGGTLSVETGEDRVVLGADMPV